MLATASSGFLKANGLSAPTWDTISLSDLSGTVLAANGGTGITSYSVGDLLFAGTNTTLSKLSGVAAGNVLLSNGVNNSPIYGKANLTSHVTGTLPVANGGTGAATLTGYVIGTGTTAMTANATIPVADLSGSILAANGGTGQSSYAIGDIVYASGATALSKLASGATNTVLRSTGLLTAPSYGKVVLTTDVSGTLPVANGGTANDGTAVTALTFDTLKFKTASQSTGALSAGQLRWNSSEGTLDLKMTGTSSVHKIGQEVLMGATSTTSILKGQVVYILSSFDGRPDIDLASNNSSSAKEVIGVASEALGEEQFGYVTMSGIVSGLNLTGYTAGQEVWLSTSGSITATEPTYPAHKVRVGFVTHADASTGSIYVAPKYFENGLVGATGKIGYTIGSGGYVEQSTNKSTPVTLNKTCGWIIMNGAALASGHIATFVLNNTKIEAGDVLILNHVSGGTVGKYSLNAQCGAGTANISVTNVTSGSASEAIVIAFVVIKAVTS
jgi:hypothetical protein